MKKNYTFLNIPLLLLLITLTTGCELLKDDENVAPSYEERQNELAQEVINSYLPADSSRDIATIFATSTPLAAGTEIRPAMNSDDFSQPPPVYSINEPFWLFVIDRNSAGNFAHNITYVLITDGNSQHEVHEENWWPLLDNNNLWFSDGHMKAESKNIVYEGNLAKDWNKPVK